MPFYLSYSLVFIQLSAPGSSVDAGERVMWWSDCFWIHFSFCVALFLCLFLLEMGWRLWQDLILGGWGFLSWAAYSGPIGFVSLPSYFTFQTLRCWGDLFLQLVVTGDTCHLNGCGVFPTVLSLIVLYRVNNPQDHIKIKKVYFLAS